MIAGEALETFMRSHAKGRLNVSAISRGASLDPTTIYAWWKGKQTPRWSSLRAIAPLLQDVAPEDLADAWGLPLSSEPEASVASIVLTPEILDALEERFRRVVREELGRDPGSGRVVPRAPRPRKRPGPR